MKPTLGRIVHYVLNEQDAESINRRRTHARAHMHEHNLNATGVIVHVGNEAHAGNIFPMMVVMSWPGDYVNGQVYLDGNDVYWATSKKEGDGLGTFHWPPRE